MAEGQVLLYLNQYIYSLDFGFALESQSDFCSTPCGSYSYGAPEIVLSPNPYYNPQLADSWSM